MSRDFFNFNAWYKPRNNYNKQWEYLDFSVETIENPDPRGGTRKPLKVDILHMPHVDMIFDNGHNRCQIDRSADGYKLMHVGPFFHKDTALNKHLEWVMASAHYLRPEDGNYAREVGLKMIADSGGAQIKFRTANYVDPEHVINAYNTCADYGMALDIPPRPGVDASNKSALRILARIQKKNNELFKAKRRPDLGLLNVIHGTRPDDFRLWIDTVIDTQTFQGWAIGLDTDAAGLYRGAAILYREYGLKESQQWLHMFGVSGPANIPVMAWIGKYIPILTSDSSSYLEGCRRRTYLGNSGGKIWPTSVGSNNFGNKGEFSLSSMIPCSCEFCNLMQYYGAWAAPGFDSAFPTLIAHNLVTLKQVGNQWNTLANDLSLNEYVQIVKKRVSPQSAIMCQYIDSLINDGVEYADKHFGKFLTDCGGMHAAAIEERTTRQKTRVPLFTMSHQTNPDEISGLSSPGSNLEVIGNYLSDEELLGIYQEFNFSAHEQQLIAKREKTLLTADADPNALVLPENGEPLDTTVAPELAAETV
jgi:hypothetical protein